MKVKDYFSKWHLTNLRVKTPFLDMAWDPSEPDKDAAWDLYVELVTRVALQPLADEEGVEKTALESIHDIFKITRGILKDHGRSCKKFTKIAIVVLNQVVRPFTAKWHRQSEQGAFENPEHCAEFRAELRDLQIKLRNYTGLLADLAEVEELEVEDLTYFS